MPLPPAASLFFAVFTTDRTQQFLCCDGSELPNLSAVSRCAAGCAG